MGADLSAADLTSATLIGTNLREANLRAADFSGAIIASVIFGGVDLSEVKGLHTSFQVGPSTVGIDTIYRSKGKFPEEFVRAAGVPDNFITFMKSLTVGPAIEFYSCFISYSSADKDFAERLYGDLQARNVRCWFAPEDLKIGENFRSRIDESIQVHEKLLLVLTRHSIRSSWVEKEVETAFERERRENRIVLFPIRLDPDVMETAESWAADIRRTRHVGDFTGWKNPGRYKKAFERLLRDLKAEPSL